MDHALVLAGGLGERLWPLSRKQAKTKESVNIASMTMLELTVKRLSQWVDKKRIWIVSSREVPTYGCRLIREPTRKNTAAAVAWGLSVIHGLDPNAFVGIFPVDHLISPFETVLLAINEAKETNNLIALGIEAKDPSKQYGYILPQKSDKKVKKVERFLEKPLDPQTLLNKGYLINSGIYMGPARKILAEIGLFLPKHFQAAKSHDRSLFARLRPVSLDKGVMEHTKRLFCLPLEVEWEDIGTWSNFLKHAGEKGQSVKHNSPRSMVYAKDSLVVLSGVEDVVVVENDGIVLVMKKQAEKDMADVVDKVRQKYPGYA